MGVIPGRTRRATVPPARRLYVGVDRTKIWKPRFFDPISAPPLRRLAPGVNGESFAKRSNIVAHVSLDLVIAFPAILGESGENKSNELTNLLQFLNAEAARGSRRGAKPNSRRNRWPFRIKRDAIFIASKTRAFQCLSLRFAGDPDGAKVDKHDMAVCTAGDDSRAAPG